MPGLDADADVGLSVHDVPLAGGSPRMSKVIVQMNEAVVHDLSRARMVQGLRALHRPYGVYDQCEHQHEETDEEALYIDGVGWTCDEALLMTICAHCCVVPQYGQSEDCATDHIHLPGYALCPTMAIVEGRESPWRA